MNNRVRFGKTLKNLRIPCNRSWVIPSLTIAIYLSAFWNPITGLLDTGIFDIGTEAFTAETTSFHRVIGQALLNGISISKRIQHIAFYGFVFLPALFLIVFLFFCWNFRKSDKICLEGINFLNEISIAAFPVGVIQLFSRTLSDFGNIFSPSILILIVLTACFLKAYPSKDRFIGFKRTLFTAIALLPVGFLLFRYFNSALLHKVPLKMIAMLISIVFITIVMLLWLYFNRSKDSILTNAYIPCFFLMIASSVVLELVNVLNQHGIFVRSKAGIIAGLFVVCILSGYPIYRKYSNAGRELNWEAICYPALILGLSMLLVQPEIQIIADTEVFERANWGSDIVGLFSAGELPIIENLNAHLLGEDIGGILFSLLNGGAAIDGAYFMYAWIVPLFFLLLYYLLCQFTERDFALLITLFMPWYGMGTLIRLQDAIGFICILAAAYALKRDSFRSTLLFCLACAVLCVYKADTAMAFSAAAIIVLTGIFALKRERSRVVMLWLTGGCVGVGMLILFFLLCKICGILPLPRLLEMLDVLLSNEKWAYANVDTAYSFQFYFAYLLVPLSTVGCMAGIVFWKKKLCCTDCELLVILSLGIAYLINFQRGIVRHNLLEGQWGIILYTAPLCIAFSVWIFTGKKNIFLPLCLGGLLLMQILTGADRFSGSSLIQSSLNRQSSESIYTTYQEKVDRVVFSQELQEIYIPLKNFMDATLSEDETYLDFSDQTLFYALLERKKPCYINQSPSLLNSEFSQLLFISEIEDVDCPYALLQEYSAGFDGVPRNVSAYLVAEYIYSNYRPFYSINGHNLWVRNDEFEEKNRIAQEYINSTSDDIQALGYLNEGMHTYDLKEIPYLWAQYDKGAVTKPQTEWTTAETSKPIQMTVTGKASGGFTVGVDQLPSNITDIWIPVWCSSVEGQDDLIWYKPEISNNAAILDVDVKAHGGQSGSYEIHVYTEVDGNMAFLDGVTVAAGPDIATAAIEKSILVQDVVKLDPDVFINQSGNYIEFSVTSAVNGQASATFVDGNGQPLLTWNFRVRAGNGRYRIRISSDDLWWSGLCQGFTLSLPDMQEVVAYDYRILEGDIASNSFNFLQKAALRQVGEEAGLHEK